MGPSDDEIVRFATEWIAETIRGQERTHAGDGVFADQFIGFQAERPDVAFTIALKIAELSDHPWIVEVLGAGALETILHEKKETVLPAYEQAGRRLTSFRDALDCVWSQGSEEQDYWIRFEALRERLRGHPRP